MGKKNIGENVWLSKRKWRMKDPHQLRFDDLYGEPDIYPKYGTEGYEGKDTWKKFQKTELVKKVFKNFLETERPLGKPRERWLDVVEKYVKEMGVRGWRRIARVGRRPGNWSWRRPGSCMERAASGEEEVNGISMNRALINCVKYSNTFTLSCVIF